MGEPEEKSCMLLKKLYGRDKEVEILHSVYDRVTRQQEFHQEELIEYDENGKEEDDNSSSNGVQLVLIGGQSGTGKSDLVWNTFSSACHSHKKKDCIFGYGKFQKRRDSKPLSVISNIMSDVILSLQNMPNAQEYKNRMMAELGNDEILVIAKLVPMVAECADVDTGVDISLDTQEGLDQLKSAFRHFLRIISNVDPSRFPVVMCLDDIQWACDSTLDMFTSILTDPELRHVVVIGCYRDDELDNACSCGKRWIETITERFTLTNNENRISRINLGNIAVLAIKELISDILKLDIDKEETSKLAELIESRTCGNPFHVLQLIDHLKAEGLIKRNELTYRWTWDYDTVHQQTMLSDNVATIVTAKMKRFPNEVQNCLTLASCLGFRFCPHVLNLLVKHKVVHCDNVDQSIQIAIDEGLVESSNDGRLRFVHDKVYETAYQMVASEKAQAKVHLAIGAALLQYYFNDSTDESIHFDREDRILKDDRTLFLCVDQLKLGRDFIIGGSDDFRMKAVKLQFRAAKLSISYSAFLPAINYLEESLYLLQKGNITAFDEENNDNDPKFVLLAHAQKLYEIVDVKDRKHRLHSYKNCFVGSEAVDAMISNSMVETRDAAVSLGRRLCEEFNLFEHVTGDHEFKDERLFYKFSDKKKTKQGSSTATMDGGDEKSYCDMFVKINTSLAEMYVTTGKVKLAMKIIDTILSHAGIECEAKLPIYLIKCRILSNQSKHKEVIKKALFILNYLEGKNYSYVEEPAKLRYKFELQRIRWNLNKLSDEDILSLPLIQDDDKQHQRLLFIMQFIEVSLFETWQCKLYRLGTLLTCRFVQLTLDNGIAPLSPMGFAALAGKLLGTGNNKGHHSKLPKIPGLKASLTSVSSTRSSSSSNKSDRSSDRDSMDISSRLSNLALALAKKQIEANIVARGMAIVYMKCSLVNHLRQPITLVVDDLIKGYEYGMKIGDIQNSFRNITAYFMFYFYSGLPLVPLLPDLKRFMQQMMDYSSYSNVRMNIPVYQCVLNLTGRDNMLNPLDIYHGTAVDLRSKICNADGNACEYNKNRSYDGQESEWSYLMQIAFYCGEMEIAWEMYEKLQNDGHRHLEGGTPFHQARVFFFALIEMWYAKSTGKHKYNKDAMKHVRVVRGWVNHQGMINCVHKLQILEAELLSLDPQQNLEELKKAYDTAIVSATRSGFLQDAAVANYLAGIHFKRVLLDDDNDTQNDKSRTSTSSSCALSTSFSRLSDLASFRASTSSSTSTINVSSSLSSISTIDPDNYFFQARDMYNTWGATAVIKSLEFNFPTIFRNNDDAAPTSKRGTRGFRSRERFTESVQTDHSKLPDHLRASIHHMATSRT